MKKQLRFATRPEENCVFYIFTCPYVLALSKYFKYTLRWHFCHTKPTTDRRAEQGRAGYDFKNETIMTEEKGCRHCSQSLDKPKLF